ncbi:DUF6456 domain-containing protein [uncultured Cohaesibacter sp.]|uniref:DUF6456 domain-containing protein n=1 Tax=uncultured Cohaesibacter sp. TaxID=1002546 RepID=UPI0029C8CBB4|nr:DUF6456 domain-containing protein [uncultured Cohaesibacter sp.]
MTKEELKLLKTIARGALKAHGDADAATMHGLLRRGAIVSLDGKPALTREGRQALRRAKLAEEEDNVYAAQHQDRIPFGPDHVDGSKLPEDSEGNADARLPRINRAESPLAILCNRKRPDGSPWLSASQFEAGERLRRDFERSQMVPSTGMNWDRLGQTGGEISKKARGKGRMGDLADGAVAARARFYAALDELGEEFSAAIVDFCCYQRGLEDIERRHQWPSRSAKQIMRMGLARLARHFGLSDRADGPASNRTRHWGDEGYRPTLR